MFIDDRSPRKLDVPLNMVSVSGGIGPVNL
jgi:hypothetical protein